MWYDLDVMVVDWFIVMMLFDLYIVWVNIVVLQVVGLLYGVVMLYGYEVVMGVDGFVIGELCEFEVFGLLIVFVGEGCINLGIVIGEEFDLVLDFVQCVVDMVLLLCGMVYCVVQGIISFVNMDGNCYMLELLVQMCDDG